jgi:hypothetical protein
MEDTNSERNLITKLEGENPLGRPKHRLEDKTKMDFKDTGHEGAGCIHLAHDTEHWHLLMSMVMNPQVP